MKNRIQNYLGGISRKIQHEYEVRAVELLLKVKSLNVNKRTGEFIRKGCITDLYVKRAATSLAELEQLPADGG